ncbi:zinc finger protein OZF-like [Penaeus chinensis]|uniref:zinc finger protein OZF-like n=1 Tax=Penaeus chinensis TaxID=139456 RepID=UPI001FB8567A|nr:zinc finger protein OZF-like [Penaeus chinensis]
MMSQCYYFFGLFPAYETRDKFRIMRSFEPLPCPICQRSYSSPGNLKQHLENIHMSSNELNFECRICGNKFKSKWYLHKHLHRAHHIRGRKET